MNIIQAVNSALDQDGKAPSGAAQRAAGVRSRTRELCAAGTIEAPSQSQGS